MEFLKSLGLIACLATIAPIFISCSGKPKVSEMENEIVLQIEKESRNKIKLIDFEKESEEEKEAFGNKRYTVHYKAEIEVLEDTWMTMNQSRAIAGDYRTFEKKPSYLAPARFPLLVTKGQRITVRGIINYKKTDDGWIKEENFRLF